MEYTRACKAEVGPAYLDERKIKIAITQLQKSLAALAEDTPVGYRTKIEFQIKDMEAKLAKASQHLKFVTAKFGKLEKAVVADAKKELIASRDKFEEAMLSARKAC